MVILHVKKGDESQFLYDTTISCAIDELTVDITSIYNGRLKISRLCGEMEELAKHGTMLSPEILGLTDEQVEELKLVDEWGEKCLPSGGFTDNKDPIGRRNGKQPSEKMRDVIAKTVAEAKAMVSKKLVQEGVPLKLRTVHEAIDILRGATMIVYPMGLPPHDPIRQELTNTEDLGGTQALLEVMDVAQAQLWFTGREMAPGKVLADYVGRNEKTKAVVKLQKRGQGPPGREPVMTEEERKQMMLHAYRRQEDFKSRAGNSDDQHRRRSAERTGPGASTTRGGESDATERARVETDGRLCLSLSRTMTTSISTPRGPIAAV